MASATQLARAAAYMNMTPRVKCKMWVLQWRMYNSWHAEQQVSTQPANAHALAGRSSAWLTSYKIGFMQCGEATWAC